MAGTVATYQYLDLDVDEL